MTTNDALPRPARGRGLQVATIALPFQIALRLG